MHMCVCVLLHRQMHAYMLLMRRHRWGRSMNADPPLVPHMHTHRHAPPRSLTCTHSAMYMDVVPPLAPLNMEMLEELKMDCSADVSLKKVCQKGGMSGVVWESDMGCSIEISP